MSEKENGYKNGGIGNPGFVDDNGVTVIIRDKPYEDSEDSQDEEWGVVEMEDESTPWEELTSSEKVIRVLSYIVRIIAVLALLYFFICSIGVLSAAFQLLGGRAAGDIFSNDSILGNPIAGLMMGVLVTVLVQSSSTSTSIIVTMVGAGILDVPTAIPIIMGANIGTSVTNTIVSLGQVNDKNQFRRAFAGATVHDMFNWLTVLIILPIDIIVDSITGTGGYLYHLSYEVIQAFFPDEVGGGEDVVFLDAITDPLTEKIIKIDKSVIEYIAKEEDREKWPLIQYWCDEVDYTHNCLGFENPDEALLAEAELNSGLWTYHVNKTVEEATNYTILCWDGINETLSTKCDFLFVGQGTPGSSLSEETVGIILLVLSLLLLIICLVCMVKVLSSLMKGSVAKIIMKVINWEFEGVLGKLGITGYIAMGVGAGITILVQSSSVFTSTVTPLVGLGVVTVERMYPLTLGSNIGTTVTSILAALSDSTNIENTLQIAFVHLFFNISGILLFYPIPITRQAPIRLAKKLGYTTADYRWFAAVYLVLVFFFLPGLVFALSLAGTEVLLGILVPIAVLVIVVVIINVLQDKKPSVLPVKLRSWDWLPKPLHSLEPYDSVCGKCCFCCSGKDKKADKNEKQIVVIQHNNDSEPEVTTISGKVSNSTDF